jgi:divalent metal cation (Fe/Co/Zn/Cd) transporter
MDTIVDRALDNESKMREQELRYLRDELNQRLSYYYEHTHKVFQTILFLCGGILVLLTAKQENFMGNIFMLFMMITIFFISVVVLYFLSYRNFRILDSIHKIGAYIAIFYEKRSSTKKDGIFFWELVNFEIAKENMDKPDGKHKYSKFNNECFWLSFIAIFIKILFLFIFYVKFPCPLKNLDASDVIMTIICVLYIVISVFLSYRIFKNSFLDSKKLFDSKKDHLNSFLNYAIDTGYYPKEEVKERFGKYFYNEIGGDAKLRVPRGLDG